MADPSGGRLVHHERHGTGPALVLVHGLGATSRFFDAAVAGLARDHTVVTLDLRGHGRTPRGQEPASLLGAARDLRAVLDELALRDATLVGWSLGATVAYTYLEAYGPHRVARLVSVEQSPFLLSDGGWEHAAFGGLDEAAARQVDASLRGDAGAFTADLVRTCFAAGHEPGPAALAPLVAEAAACSAEAMRELWADVLRQDWRDRITTLGVPVLFVHGAHSRVYPTAVGAWLAHTVPDSRHELFEHSGHLPFVEEPERFCGLVRAFAAGRDGAHRGTTQHTTQQTSTVSSTGGAPR